MTKIGYVTTIQVVIPAGECANEAEAADWVHAMMDDTKVLDWTYLAVGGQYLYPTEIVYPADYTEGDAFE